LRKLKKRLRCVSALNRVEILQFLRFFSRRYRYTCTLLENSKPGYLLQHLHERPTLIGGVSVSVIAPLMFSGYLEYLLLLLLLGGL
jgi:hypothetical protein